MALQFYLRPNHMTDDPNNYIAVSRNPESYTLEDIFEHMTREGSTITKAEALAGFEEVTRGIIRLVAQGNSVITPLVNIRPTVRGVFDGKEDNFDPARHQVSINVSPGLRLKGITNDIPTEKIAPRERKPEPMHLHDSETDLQDQRVTPKGGARITGTLLKFDAKDPKQGIFFVNIDDNSEIPVESNMIKNKPKELVFINPDLETGMYRLEVRSKIKDTSKIRKGILPEELTVVNPD
ncbi:DUF4469 domain-containing protein [Aliifodinibius sp. S!AR15-10]|uniref:DNA-binding domain-containing protein n=1 Tax=Aliifodinibius sp. S!AR15-10 TaxID=2950437 RepID=UPI00285E2EE6|nr:DNA-binding domain-containing protein [Aliifodinibius sp. S!AR15-10]MDR8393324.1 DUF4469 domain-containing protein [Aliifodinibius sp. S!AR15-10]